MAFGPASRLGVALFEDADPIDLWPSRSNEEVETVISYVYKQVLGNAYVIESEEHHRDCLKNRKSGLEIRDWERISAVLSLQSLIPNVHHSSKISLRFDQFCRQLSYTKISNALLQTKVLQKLVSSKNN